MKRLFLIWIPHPLGYFQPPLGVLDRRHDIAGDLGGLPNVVQDTEEHHLIPAAHYQRNCRLEDSPSLRIAKHLQRRSPPFLGLAKLALVADDPGDLSGLVARVEDIPRTAGDQEQVGQSEMKRSQRFGRSQRWKAPPPLA